MHEDIFECKSKVAVPADLLSTTLLPTRCPGGPLVFSITLHTHFIARTRDATEMATVEKF